MNIFLEYIPQILFLMGLFGWLVFLMLVKFVTFYEAQTTVCVCACVHVSVDVPVPRLQVC